MRLNLRQQIANGRYTLTLMIIIYLASFFILRKDTHIANDGFLWNMLSQNFPHLSSSKWMTLILHAITAYMILEIDAVFALNRVRTTFHISSFLFLLTINPTVFNIGPHTVASILILSSLFPVFYSYQNKNSSPRMFYTGLMFSICTMFVPSTIWIAIVYFISIGYIGILNIKNVLAWIWGAILPYMMLASFCYYFNCTDLFFNSLSELFNIGKINYTSLHLFDILNITAIAILILVSFGHLLHTSFLDKIKTRIFLYIISWIPLLLMLTIFIEPDEATGIISVAYPFISIMIAHLFCYSDSKGGNIFFVVTLTALSALFIFNIYNIYA